MGCRSAAVLVILQTSNSYGSWFPPGGIRRYQRRETKQEIELLEDLHNNREELFDQHKILKNRKGADINRYGQQIMVIRTRHIPYALEGTERRERAKASRDTAGRQVWDVLGKRTNTDLSCSTY